MDVNDGTNAEAGADAGADADAGLHAKACGGVYLALGRGGKVGRQWSVHLQDDELAGQAGDNALETLDRGTVGRRPAACVRRAGHLHLASGLCRRGKSMASCIRALRQ